MKFNYIIVKYQKVWVFDLGSQMQLDSYQDKLMISFQNFFSVKFPLSPVLWKLSSHLNETHRQIVRILWRLVSSLHCDWLKVDSQIQCYSKKSLVGFVHQNLLKVSYNSINEGLYIGKKRFDVLVKLPNFQALIDRAAHDKVVKKKLIQRERMLHTWENVQWCRFLGNR